MNDNMQTFLKAPDTEFLQTFFAVNLFCSPIFDTI